MATKSRSGRSGKGLHDLTAIMDPFVVSPTTVELAISLLRAKEPDILYKTLNAISIFAKQDYDNKKLLYNLKIVDYLLPHITHPQFNVRRFALINLALMCLLPQVPMEVLSDPDNMKKLTTQLVKVEDIFTLEYTSLCISRLTTIHEGCKQLTEADILGTICKRMKDSADPDVQKNCLQTLSNMLEDPKLSGEVTKNSFFSWAAILVLLQSKFVGLQNAALKVVSLLVSRYDDTAVQTKFRASTGVTDLCHILERYDFRDVHVDILKILKLFVVSGENAKHLYTAGCIPKLRAYLEMALPQLKPYCLAVFTQLTFTREGRDVIFTTTTDFIFCEHILDSNLDMLADAALGVANMCAILNSAVRMSETPGFGEGLCSILVDDTVPWVYIRINTLKALVGLSRLVKPIATLVMKTETFTPLRNINVQYTANPEEAQMLALQCYLSLLTYTKSAFKVMMCDSFIKELLDVIKRVNIKLQILAVRTMSVLTQDENGKDFFTYQGGEEVVSEKLKINHNGLRNALCQLILDSCTYEGAEVYLQLGTISYMFNNQTSRFTIINWEKALRRILKMHPSAKFALLGRLDADDYTIDGFYVLKRLEKTFPSFSSIMANSTTANDPVYIAIMNPNHQKRGSVDAEMRGTYMKLFRGYLSSISMSNRNFMAQLPDDENLKDNVNKLRHLLGDPKRSLQYVEMFESNYDIRERKKCGEVGSNLRRKAQILAEFVVSEMNNSDNDEELLKCSMPNVELHIAGLMKQFKSNVIGIGFIKHGGMLERAILYKVLADRLGIPCAIYRKCTAIAWCAIAVPEIVKPTNAEEKYTAKYLRVNYVVDLSNNAEKRLHQEEGPSANRIRGPSIPPYVVGDKKVNE